MKKLIVSFVSAAALATVGMAAAGGSTAAYDNNSASNNNAAGIFVSGALGYGYVGYKKSDFFGAPTKLDRSGLAWNANVGYQFNQYVAVEGGYSQFGQGKASFPGGETYKTTLRGFGADVKGILPINDQFNVFAKAGAVDMHENTDQSGATIGKLTGSAWTPMLGLGTSYNINHNVALTLQDVYTFRTNFTKSGAKVNIPYTNDILAGVSYKFNV
ncbi:MAG: hypothetical protein COY58_07575 [Gammaproteobacteria bacterium CG_4_10_14_0_8_um_filter_38_16]|nr:MAG: hypothetical protein COY58_07575 [Gammaproteobacteria bacterium CG_4_10_14_0_8_um_filter_38_16]PJA02678.1 MAG: hypothetical protein COX72_09095 [Gammaproteobacteria bacterium CG_4_10_14_0_2_um_filter_38_22]PJB10862.1 MAG: hypothetical protein CO120_02680 [Gammaproteobacteria bacterium CG_4_9_14_3_um_filter_38_9]